jgi:hypothetical protein
MTMGHFWSEHTPFPFNERDYRNQHHPLFPESFQPQLKHKTTYLTQ